MKKTTKRRTELASWLALREREGLTYEELSQRSGIAAATFSRWSWRFRSESESPFSELEITDDDDVGLDDNSPSAASTSPIRIRLGDAVVEADRSFDADTLARVIDVLRRRC